MQFKAGQKLTLIQLGALAHTVKHEITVVTVLPEPQPHADYTNGPVTRHRHGTYKDRGKRKEYYLTIPAESLVFEGWDLPIKVDSELKRRDGTSGFHGNACFNLGGLSPEEMKDWIENKALNRPVPDDVKGRVLLIPVDANGIRTTDADDDGEILYPEINVHCAPLERLKERRAA